MEQQPNKYHISDDGNIYRVNEDGSFTSMGNVEQRSKAQNLKDQRDVPIRQQAPYNQPNKRSTIGIIFFNLMNLIGLVLVLSALILKYDGYLFIQILGGILILLSILIKSQMDKK